MKGDEMDGFEYAEAEAVRVLGINQVNFRAVRKSVGLIEGEDWRKVENRVMYTAEGLKKAVHVMSGLKGQEKLSRVNAAHGPDWVEMCRLVPPELQESGKNSAPGETQLKGNELVLRSSVIVPAVVTRFFMNKRILEAEILKNGKMERVRVRVKSSENFVRKMKIKIRPRSATMYELVGRCPRYRGRW